MDPVGTPKRQTLEERAEALQHEAAARPRWQRVMRATAGAILAALAVPLLVLLPEVGVPLALVALRLLAERYCWAGRAHASVAWRADQFHAWYAGRTRPVRVLVALAAGALALAVGWFLLHESGIVDQFS